MKQIVSIKNKKCNAKFDNSFVRQVATLSWPVRHLGRLATGLRALVLAFAVSAYCVTNLLNVSDVSGPGQHYSSGFN
jgi:hypothetical protein